MKIFTSINNTSPQFVIGEIHGYAGDKLYFRKANIAPAETLTESDYETRDNMKIQFGYGDFEEDKLGADNNLSIKNLIALGLSIGVVDASVTENEAENAVDEIMKDQATAIQMNQVDEMGQHEDECMKYMIDIIYLLIVYQRNIQLLNARLN